MTTSNVALTGYNGDTVHAYAAIPEGAGPFPGVVLTHHAPGWDELSREFVRRLAEHGFMAISPNLYERFGQGHRKTSPPSRGPRVACRMRR